MTFEIGFNYLTGGKEDKLLEEIQGGNLRYDEEADVYLWDADSLEDLEGLYKEVNRIMGTTYQYSLLINFDGPRTIYFDDKA